MKARCVVIACLVITAFSQTTGTKVILTGKGWFLAGKDLRPGQTVPENAQITGAPGESSDLLLDCGPNIGSLSYSCKNAPCQVTACRTNLDNVNVQRVDAVPRESSGSFFAALFRRDPSPVALLASRAAGDISDAVVVKAGDQVHLAPALNRVLEGKYCFRFTPLPETNHSNIQTATMNWDRTSDAEGLLSAPKLAPGLYSVEKSNSDAEGACTFEPDTARAWILITPDAQFAHMNEVWTGFKGKLRAMEDANVSPDVVRTTRHAILAHLADSVEGR